MELQLRISGFHYEVLKNHLLPVDGMEAIAIAICGRFTEKGIEYLLIHDLTLIPYEDCTHREYGMLKWKTDKILPYFERISNSNLAILKIHSHPGGYKKFSDLDNLSDNEFFSSVFGWSCNNYPHASAIMLPDGEIFGRFYFEDLKNTPIKKISIVGDIIKHYSNSTNLKKNNFALRTIQAFGERTYQMLSKMTVGVVGCSGTGSPVIEQLVRLGVGKLVLVDPDIVEEKNLNRILNTTMYDAIEKKPKVKVITDMIKKIGLKTITEHYQVNLFDNIKALKALVKCDAVFGCVDSIDGRHIINQLCSFYIIPYFDLGVKLEANGTGGINKICCSVHYIQPCKSSLLSRGVYTTEDLRASSQLRKNLTEYENLKKNAYIKNVNVDNPAVISVNMQIASHAINEFLNRIHPYKTECPSHYASSTIDITESYIVNSNELDFKSDMYLKKKCGRGDIVPFIEISEINL